LAYLTLITLLQKERALDFESGAPLYGALRAGPFPVFHCPCRPPLHPRALIAELTHRCPPALRLCSNPRNCRLSQRALHRILGPRLKEAAASGVLQAEFTGGELSPPRHRPNISAPSRSAGRYVISLTSGLPWIKRNLAALVGSRFLYPLATELSKCSREETANEIAGTKSHAQKLRVLDWLSTIAVCRYLHFVLHRAHLSNSKKMLALAESSERRGSNSPTAILRLGLCQS